MNSIMIWKFIATLWVSSKTNCKTMYIQIGKKAFKYVALITMLWSCVNPSQLPTEVITDITFGVLQHYHSTCVHMLHLTQEPGQCETICFEYQSVPTFLSPFHTLLIGWFLHYLFMLFQQQKFHKGLNKNDSI
jgi:hypothetical protein